MRPSLAALLLTASLVSVPAVAQSPGADDRALERASALYERGQRAHAAGHYGDAARHFAAADELVPDPAAVEAALAAALLSDDAVFAMELADRAMRGGPSKGRRAEALASAVGEKFAPAVGKLVVLCEGCRVQLDGRAIAPQRPRWATVGKHRVVARRRGQREQRQVTVRSGRLARVVPFEHAAASTGERPNGDGPSGEARPGAADPADAGQPLVSPAWFYLGLGLTLVGGGLTIASAVDTKGKHDDFEQAPSAALADEGEGAQLRTNVALGVTGALALTTAVLGVLSFGGGRAASARLLLTPSGAQLGVSGSF
jgi:hypothetical protein